MPAAKKKGEKKKAKKEAEHKSLWQNYNERPINTNARVKQLKPNGQMERVGKMTKKDQGERGMEKNPLLPPDRKPYMVTNSL